MLIIHLYLEIILNKKESGGLKKLKNTIKLKSKQFKDFSMKKEDLNQAKDFQTTKSFNALSLIDKAMKKDFNIKARESKHHHWKSKDLSQKLGVTIPVYKLTDQIRQKKKDILNNNKYQNFSQNSWKNNRHIDLNIQGKKSINKSHIKPPLSMMD
mmetsp:Transcript_23320/g.20701  ORF Transcript_23320/g.20701 Transcript_23320/m.20701 type:complete len:155 (-) Transcript_23320:905-1369(-)